MPSLDRNLNDTFSITDSAVLNRLANSSVNGSGSAIISTANASDLVASGSVYIPGSRPLPIVPTEQHKLNVDPSPTLIRKKPTRRLEYIQNISLRFLRPPHPPKPGDINIVQEADVQAQPAPPLHITQKPPLPKDLPPLIFRERPPKPPASIEPRTIVIPGKIIPPPPRKVIVERLPSLPQKPQDIIIERWLGYKRRIRNVQFKPAPALVTAPAPKNVLIKWYYLIF